MELLFESRREIVARKGRLIAFQAEAKISPVPVMAPRAGESFALYGTVLEEDGKFRMWHQAAPPGHDWKQDFSHVAIAESADGISWQSPSDPPGGRTTLSLHSPSILKRGGGYLATGCSKRSAGIHPGATQPGYYLAASRDGVDWELVPGDPIPGGDVITSIWDERAGVGRAMFKLLRYNGGILRRALFEASFTAAGWGPSRLALMPGDADDLAAVSRGFHSADYYGMTLLPAGAAGMLGFVWMFYHQPPYFHSGAGVFGGGALALAYRERADDAWGIAPGRIPFLEPVSRDRFFYAASSVLTRGDEQWLYCTVFHGGHGSALNEERRRDSEAVRRLQEEGLASIHLARWKRDRFFGFRAETEADLVLDLGPVTRPARLLLNYRTAPRGWVRVRAAKAAPGAFLAGFSKLPEEAESGYSFADCRPLQGDETAAAVAWDGAVNLPLTGPQKPLILTVRMFMAECYAYEIVPIDVS